MKHDIDQIASDFVAYARFENPNEAPDEITARGQALYELVEEDPAIAWEAIKAVVRRYPAEDFYAVEKTEAQVVVGRLAAGPFEDWLSAYGMTFIEPVEIEARSDLRMAWTLGGIWRSTMSDDIWGRLQCIADHSYWGRPATECPLPTPNSPQS